MSLIADALQKANVSSPVSPSTPRSPRPTWIYWGAGLLGLALILWVRSSSTTASTPPPTAAAPASSRPTGLNLLRIAEGQWRLSGIVQGGN